MSAFSGYLVFLFASFAATFSGAAERQVLQQRLAELTGTFPVVGDFPATNRLHATLCLPLRNAAGLSNLLGRMYGPRSPDHRRYLTPETFTEQFGPSKDDFAAVVAFAQAQGLTVSATHSNRTLVELAGTTADFERAFHLRLRL